MDAFAFPELSPQSESWLSRLMPEFSAEGAVSDMLGGSFDFGFGGVAEKLAELFFGEIGISLRTLALLLTVSIFLAVIRNLQSSFGRESVAAAANAAAAAYLTAIALSAFSTAKSCALGAVDDLSLIMDAILPVTLSLMLSGGMAVSGEAVHPVIYFMCTAMTGVIRSLIVPLAMFSMALHLLGCLSPGINAAGLADLCKRLSRSALSFLMLIFTGVLSVTRFAASSFDSLAARGLKFAVSAAVPVVGGSIADAMNSVAGGSVLLKNSIGAAGAAVMIGVALLPVVKIGALSLVFRAGGALMGAMGGSAAADAVYSMAGCLEMLLSSVACTAVMMLIAVAAIMGG